MLKEAISESTRRCADIHGHNSSNVELKVIEGMFQLVSTAADIPLGCDHLDSVAGSNAVTGLGCRVLIDGNGTGHDDTLGPLTAFAQPAFDKGLI
jgi:hypothetical protein